MIYLAIILGVMILDRVVKVSVSSGMAPGDSIPLIENIFHITYVRNEGAAFSMLQGHPTLLIIFPAVVLGIGIIFICVKKNDFNAVFLVSLSLIIGGGLGNLTDRLAQGYVVDMFDFRFFPVFNVADIAVCVGCGLLMLYMAVYSNRETGNGRKK